MEDSLKKIILITSASIAGFFLLAVFGFLLFFNAQFKVYQDAHYKFSIKYPKSWRVIRHPHAKVAVAFLRPKDTALDTFRENFNVTVQPLPDDAPSLPVFTATIKNQMTAVFGKTIFVVEDKPLEWGGWHEGHEMVIVAPKPDHLQMVTAWLLYNNQAYILTFLGDMHKYTNDVLVINEMIRSFKLQ